MEIRIRFTEPHRRQRMAIFVTREEHVLAGLMEAVRKGQLKQAQAALVLSNRKELAPLARRS